VRVAVFDSGVGGLTVAKSLIHSSIFSEIIYYGDTARVPYGTKDANTVIRYSLEALEFFANFDPEMMIVACNSATAYALEELKKAAPFPVYGVIKPGVLAVARSPLAKTETILVIGTSATVKSGHYQRQLAERGYTDVIARATPLLVPLVEEGIGDEAILTPVFDHYFRDLPQPKAVILGCTHFPLLAKQLQHYFGDALLIHSGDAIVEYLKMENIAQKEIKKTELKLFASENVHRLKEVADAWIGENG
jgi:glutamate racemase